MLRSKSCGAADVVKMRVSPFSRFWNNSDWLNGLNLTTGAVVAEVDVLITVGRVRTRRVEGLDVVVGLGVVCTAPRVVGGGWDVVVSITIVVSSLTCPETLSSLQCRTQLQQHAYVKGLTRKL